MFISIAEKTKITKDIGSMQAALDRMLTDIQYLSAKVKVLEAKPVPQPVKKTYKKKKLTAEQREKQREYARRYQAKKRLEKQNGNGISTTGQ